MAHNVRGFAFVAAIFNVKLGTGDKLKKKWSNFKQKLKSVPSDGYTVE